VLFSIALTEQKRANGNSYIPPNFGPTQQPWRRASAQRCRHPGPVQELRFCSFDPGQLEAERSAFLGVKHLKGFLVYAGLGGVSPSAAAREGGRDRHRDEVAAALRDRGLVVANVAGRSETVSKGLAVRADRLQARRVEEATQERPHRRSDRASHARHPLRLRPIVPHQGLT
jgi:hypothetical protein